MPNVDPIKKYPPNSRKTKENEEERVVVTETEEITKIGPSVPSGDPSGKLAKVVKGKVLKKKKSWLDGFTESFFGDDAKSVASYVLWDVLIPAAKDTILEMLKTGGEMLLFGEGRRSESVRRDRDRSIVSYNRMSGHDRDRDRRPIERERNRSRFNFDDIVLERRSDGEQVLESLVDQIDEFGVATVADFYDLVDMTGEYTDQDWGWDNLSRAVVERVRDGYVVVLPKPYALRK